VPVYKNSLFLEPPPLPEPASAIACSRSPPRRMRRPRCPRRRRRPRSPSSSNGAPPRQARIRGRRSRSNSTPAAGDLAGGVGRRSGHGAGHGGDRAATGGEAHSGMQGHTRVGPPPASCILRGRPRAPAAPSSATSGQGGSTTSKQSGLQPPCTSCATPASPCDAFPTSCATPMAPTCVVPWRWSEVGGHGEPWRQVGCTDGGGQPYLFADFANRSSVSMEIHQ
jgi:hypothetical protein